jgi:hypothetical protein
MSINSDILFRNSADNTTQVWFMDGRRIQNRASLVSENGVTAMSVGPPWSIVGVGDFNRNGGADILFHNSSSAETQIWFMDGRRIATRATVVSEDGKPIFVGPPWSIVGAGAFDSSGGADILWVNASTKETQVWFMDGQRIRNRATLVSEDGKTPMLAGPPWSIVGIGDFNKNGGADILWVNTSTRETQVWFMDGRRIQGRASLVSEDGKTPMLVGPPWSIVGIGDFNADGGADILFVNSSTRDNQIWFMDGRRIQSRASVVSENGTTPMTIGPPWGVVGVGKFNPVPSVPVPLPSKPDIREFDAVDPDNGTTRLATDLALGGSAHLLVTKTGAFTFSVHTHDSGADNINYSLAAVLMTQSGLAFTFEHQGGVEGTLAGLPFGTPRRDDNPTLTGSNSALKDEFDRLDGARFVGKLAGTDALVKGIEGLIADTVSAAAKDLGAAAAKALIALVA